MDRSHDRPWGTVLAAACTAGLFVAGCSSKPGRVEPPSISAGAASAAAMEAYDKNGDGSVAAEELDAAPALKASMATLDANKDDKVSAEEIQARIESWQQSRIGLATISCIVTMNGKPLEGALVTFEPEPFLGDAVKAALGETAPSGSTMASIPKENRPTPETPMGMQYGFYRVKISKIVGGKETIPARYNADTTLGQQVAGDDPEVMSHNMRFELQSP